MQARSRVKALDEQLKMLYDSRDRTTRARTRAARSHAAWTGSATRSTTAPSSTARPAPTWSTTSPASTGSRQAMERLEVYNRAAAHQKTSDNLGVVPDPIIGGVINFIDAARPTCHFLGPADLPSATWYRPKVTQHTLVAAQGSAGAAADEKSELV